MADLITIWILDVGYELINSIPYVLVWGISDKDERILVADPNFKPYFYAVPKEDANLDTLIDSIQHIKGVDRVEQMTKKYFGRPTKVLRVTCKLPTLIPKIRDVVKKHPDIVNYLEADIRFYMRYLIDNGIFPCKWYSFKGYEVSGGYWEKYNVAKIYLLQSKFEPVNKDTVPALRILSFDIECYNPMGSPDPKSDPIIIISTKNSLSEKRQFIMNDNDDKKIILSFTDYVQEYDPDIIVGYNSNRFDWIYLVERARIHNIKLEIGRDRSAPHPSVYGHQSIVGRANLDLMDYAEILYDVKTKTLKEVVDYLGLMAKEDRTIIPQIDIYKYWDDPSKRSLLLKYAQEDADATFLLSDVALPFAIELSKVVGLTLDQVLAASVGFRVEWFLMRFAFEDNELIPNREEHKYASYKGALVFTPEKGLFENVVYMDFTSLYPSLMIKYNIGPDTYIPPFVDLPSENINIAPEVGHRFLKSPSSLYKKALSFLLGKRKEILNKMKSLAEDSLEYKMLDARQRALKIIANASYGYTGWTGARWYIRQIAEATTAWGRATIEKAKQIAEDLGLTVYYGDTDSLFLEYTPEKIKKFTELVEKELELEIKPDKIYKVIFFTGSKKKYAGIDEHGNLDITGFEVVRGDWAEIAREVQKEVLRYVLEEKNPDNAVKYVKKVIRKLKKKEIPYEKLIIWKTISRPLDEYKTRSAHITAAKHLRAHGYVITPGRRIGYVIIKGEGKLADRAKPFQFANYNEIDIDYYINNQIITVAQRILSVFDISESQLLESQASLADFF